MANDSRHRRTAEAQACEQLCGCATLHLRSARVARTSRSAILLSEAQIPVVPRPNLTILARRPAEHAASTRQGNEQCATREQHEPPRELVRRRRRSRCGCPTRCGRRATRKICWKIQAAVMRTHTHTHFHTRLHACTLMHACMHAYVLVHARTCAHNRGVNRRGRCVQQNPNPYLNPEP